MALDFDKYAREGKEFINELAEGLGYPDDQRRAGRVLKSVLHTLRNHLTTEESVQMISQLPMFLKAAYVDNWSIKTTRKRVKHVDDFYNEVLEMNKQTSAYDFPEVDDVNQAVTVVFFMLKKYVSQGELDDIKAVLPTELKSLIDLSVPI